MSQSPEQPLTFDPDSLNRLADILDLGAISAADHLQDERRRDGFSMGVRFSVETLRHIAREGQPDV